MAPDLAEKLSFFYDCFKLSILCILYYITYIFQEIFWCPDIQDANRRLRCVLITGAAGGLGRALALNFARRGSTLVLCDIDSEGVEGTRRFLKEAGYTDVRCFTVDLASEESIEQFLGDLRKSELAVSCIVNNAATVKIASVGEDPKELLHEFKVNALSHAALYKHFVPQMRKANCGHIVTISSVLGDYDLPLICGYCATKSVATHLHCCLRLELKAYYNKLSNSTDCASHVKTTIVFPYMLDTGLFEGMRTRAQFLFPAVSYIDAAAQIVKAVENGEEELFIPRYFALFRLARIVLPSWLYDRFLLKVLGVGETVSEMKRYQTKGSE